MKRQWQVRIYRGAKLKPAVLGAFYHTGENPEDFAIRKYGRRIGMYLLLLSQR